MLHYIACAALAYFLARYLNARFPGWITAVWSSGVATIAGLVGGSFIVLGALNLLGMPVNHNALPRAFGQAFLWSVVGTAAGIYHGRQKAATGAHGTVAGIPMKAWFGWGVVAIVVVVGAVAILGRAIPELPRADAPAKQQEQIDWENWTQESTNSADTGPWLQYAPPGTRFCRLADRTIVTVYPPGVKPQAEKANPFCASSSVPSPDQL